MIESSEIQKLRGYLKKLAPKLTPEFWKQFLNNVSFKGHKHKISDIVGLFDSAKFIQISAAYTVNPNDSNIEITSGTFLITLPDPTTMKIGKPLTFTNTGTGIVTFSEPISGDSNFELRNLESIEMISNGTNYIA